uniref:Uncharacterized protein n=1 Tax=Arundo donax TaxID=35708 RepID=A0A0A9EMY8_ARUDO
MVWGLDSFLFQEHIFKLISYCQKEEGRPSMSVSTGLLILIR